MIDNDNDTEKAFKKTNSKIVLENDKIINESEEFPTHYEPRYKPLLEDEAAVLIKNDIGYQYSNYNLLVNTNGILQEIDLFSDQSYCVNLKANSMPWLILQVILPLYSGSTIDSQNPTITIGNKDSDFLINEKWNALKLLNNNGEFLSPDNVALIIKDVERTPNPSSKGKITQYHRALEDHIDLVLSQKEVSKEKISSKSFSVAVDGINSVGGVAIPEFLNTLGIKKIKKINCIPDGAFAHNPEPLPENLTEICSVIKKGNFDLGIVVDPDADRLCLIDENGEPFGEEYTLVAAAEHIISKINKPVTCSNMSSSLALKKITELYDGEYFSSPVGEINVVEKMKQKKADIGGEGNGGVIFPSTHYGRDSLIGIGLILTLLSERDISLSELKKSLPTYYIHKTKTTFDQSLDKVVSYFSNEYSNFDIDLRDGIRIDFLNSWTHIRKSNTEPVVRIISEASTSEKASELSNKIISKLQVL